MPESLGEFFLYRAAINKDESLFSGTIEMTRSLTKIIKFHLRSYTSLQFKSLTNQEMQETHNR